MSESLWPHGLYNPWNSPSWNTGVNSHFLLQGIFPTQGLNSGLLHSRWILYQLSHQGRPRILEWVAYPFPRGSSWPRNWTGVSWTAGGFFTSWTTREAQTACGRTKKHQECAHQGRDSVIKFGDPNMSLFLNNDRTKYFQRTHPKLKNFSLERSFHFTEVLSNTADISNYIVNKLTFIQSQCQFVFQLWWFQINIQN